MEISGSARGYTNHTERLVRVAVGLDDINAARVLLHEAAHMTLHGPDSGFITTEQYAASRTHRGTAEIQADGAAYVLADLLGLDTEQASIGYVAGWAAAAAGTRTDADAITRSGPRDRRCHPPRGQHHHRGNRPGRLTPCDPRSCPVHYRARQDPGWRPSATSAAHGSAPPATHHGEHTVSPAAPAATGRGARRGSLVFGALA